MLKLKRLSNGCTVRGHRTPPIFQRIYRSVLKNGKYCITTEEGTAVIKHLEENNVGYFEHLFFALKVAGALIIHAVLPWVLVTYASDRLNARKRTD